MVVDHTVRQIIKDQCKDTSHNHSFLPSKDIIMLATNKKTSVILSPNINSKKASGYVPLSIEDDNIDHMVRLISYEPLDNFFTRHPSLTDYEDIIRDSETEAKSRRESSCSSSAGVIIEGSAGLIQKRNPDGSLFASSVVSSTVQTNHGYVNSECDFKPEGHDIKEKIDNTDVFENERTGCDGDTELLDDADESDVFINELSTAQDKQVG